MQELYRIAKPNANCTIRVPHGGSDDAWEDQTHVRAYFPGSFQYFSQPYYWRTDYGYRGDWRTDKIRLLVRKEDGEGMSSQEIIGAARKYRNFVCEMYAMLSAIKPSREPKWELQVGPAMEIVIV